MIIKYLKANNGILEKFPVTLDEIKLSHPSTQLDEESLNNLGYFSVFIDTSLHPFNGKQQINNRKIEETVEFINGYWRIVYNVVNAYPSKELYEQAYQQKIQQVREKRNQLLKEIDVMLLRSSEMKLLGYQDDDKIVFSLNKNQELLKYKQQLRDITKENIWDFEWPKIPID